MAFNKAALPDYVDQNQDKIISLISFVFSPNWGSDWS